MFSFMYTLTENNDTSAKYLNRKTQAKKLTSDRKIKEKIILIL